LAFSADVGTAVKLWPYFGLLSTGLKLRFVVASRTRCSFHYGFNRGYLAFSADVGTAVKLWPIFGFLSELLL
jgi:hypothetical protein